MERQAQNAGTDILRGRVTTVAPLGGSFGVMYGSDFPIWDPAHELQAVLDAGFTDTELEGILGSNCRRFLGL